jgi:sec-independent protein translocase protein TatA
MFEGALQPVHWLVVLGIFMVFFGGKRLPELGKGLGDAIRGFKKAMREDETTDLTATTHESPTDRRVD